MKDEQFDNLLRATLSRRAGATHQNEAAVERVLNRVSGPLPRQRRPRWRLPAVLLDWQFAPAWPRMAALACCAVIGFFVGIAGFDRSFEAPDPAPVSLGGGGIGSITFEPEALTGARP
ncbi:MAG TPA: hypothetical protein VFP60_12285 [Pseudolabrys sp.]|nr:hypothetical protein [Pseudolabrys sp.]